MSMKELEGTELVLRISGAVEQSNLKEFEDQALAVIEGINTDLETDEDFAEAEKNIKGCQLIENRIATARSTALASTEAIAALIQTTERLEAKFRETRLMLSKMVVKEKLRRVSEIVDRAVFYLESLLKTSPVRHGFVINKMAIHNAVKGKKSITKMEDAVSAVIDSEGRRVFEMETNFVNNLEKITEAESEWPGLFPDRQNIALSAPETVEALILARVADHRMKVAEKERREKEEAERKAKEASDLSATKETVLPLPVEVPIPEPFVDFPIPPPVVGTSRYKLTVSVETDDINSVIDAIMDIPGVITCYN